MSSCEVHFFFTLSSLKKTHCSLNYTSKKTDSFLFSKEKNLFMEWKHFLKPDWKKIILTVIFIFLPFYALFNDENPYAIVILWIIGAFLMYPSIIIFLLLSKIGIETTNEQKITIIFLVSSVIYYLLSCLIIWFYYKVNKNKKNLKFSIHKRNEEKKFVEKRNIPFRINLDRNQKLYLSFLGMGIGGTLWAITSDQIELSVGIFLIFLDIIFMVFLILLSPVQNWIRRKFS